MKTATIIKRFKLNDGVTIDVTQSADSFNGLVYRGSALIGAVAAGLDEGAERLIEKAAQRFGLKVDGYVPRFYVRTPQGKYGPFDSMEEASETAFTTGGFIISSPIYVQR